MAKDGATTNTGGGASVGGDAHAGRDIVGRDQINFIVPLGSWDEIRELLFVDQPETAAVQTAATQFQTFDWAKAEQAYLDKLIVLYDRVRILGTAADVPLGNIFTQVYILDKPTAYRRHNIDELRQQGFARTAVQGQPGERTAGIELVKGGQNLFILGKPGAGKTTFLKYITLQAARKHLSRIPIFISLNEWADSPWGKGETAALMPFLVEQFAICGFPDGERFIDFLLTTGRALLLFDGLDEVKQEQAQRRRLTRLLQDFAHKYDRSQCLITCRIAANDYVFAGFADVEVADFTSEQVAEYARNSFGQNERKFAVFCAELARPENSGLAELVNTPLLLSLLCLVFDNAMRFPSNRVELYEEGLDILLRKWDSRRQIQRDEIYRQLPPKRKLHLLMNIAYSSFEAGELFFRRRVLEKRIVDYLAYLPDAPPADMIDGAMILRAMEAQHGILVERAQGIYSFSHLTFQEHLTARYMVENQSRGVAENTYRKYLTDRRWRNVFLLATNLLDDAYDFLTMMSIANHGMLVGASRLTELLSWAEGRTLSAHTPYERRAAARVVYIFLALAFVREIALALSLALDRDHVRDLKILRDPEIVNTIASRGVLDRALVFAMSRLLDLASVLDLKIENDLALTGVRSNETALALDLTLARARDLALKITPLVGFDYGLICAWSYADLFATEGIDREYHGWQTSLQEFPELVRGIVELASEAGLPESVRRLSSIIIPEPVARWQAWQHYADTIFTILRDEKDLGHEWEFSREEIDKLNDYFYANELLVQCLKVAAVSDREAILAGLFSPPGD